MPLHKINQVGFAPAKLFYANDCPSMFEEGPVERTEKFILRVTLWLQDVTKERTKMSNLERATGIKYQTLASWKNGHRRMPLDAAIKLARESGMTDAEIHEELLGEDLSLIVKARDSHQKAFELFIHLLNDATPSQVEAIESSLSSMRQMIQPKK